MRWTVLAASLWLASAAQAGTLLFLNSQPGDYIGQGAGRLVTAADGTFTASRNFDNVVNVDCDGTACDDQDACTQSDACQAGQCTGTPTGGCTAAPVPCRTRSICDPSGGACVGGGLQPDGTPCANDDACIVGESCQSGVCTGGSLLSCDDGDLCTG